MRIASRTAGAGVFQPDSSFGEMPIQLAMIGARSRLLFKLITAEIAHELSFNSCGVKILFNAFLHIQVGFNEEVSGCQIGESPELLIPAATTATPLDHFDFFIRFHLLCCIIV